MRVVDEKLLSSGVVLAALGIALIAAALRDLAASGSSGLHLSQRGAEPLLVAVFLAGAVVTWWLCRDNAELQRLAIVLVAAAGVWLLA